MKRLIYYIEDKIACRFLRREMSKDYAGKVLPIAYSKLLEYAIDQKCSTPEINYNFYSKGEKWRVNCKITLERIETLETK